MWGFVVGAGTGFLATVLSAMVAARWFTARRGLVVGILSAARDRATAVPAGDGDDHVELMAGAPLCSPIAAVACAVISARALFLRDRPQDVGLMPYGETGAAKPPRSRRDIRWRLPSARCATPARPDFWILAGTYFVCGASTNGLIGTHLIPACIDHGFSEVTGAALLATMGVFNFIGTTSSGWLADRFDNRRAAVHLLRAARTVAVLPAVLVRQLLHHDAVRGVLRPRLVRHRLADRAADHRYVRPRQGRLVYGWVFMRISLAGRRRRFLAACSA